MHYSAYHAAMCALSQVLLTQITMFRELVNVRYAKRRFTELPLFRTLQWGWFIPCLAYSYGQQFVDPNRRSLIRSPVLLAPLPYIDLFALVTYSIMLITTVLTFKPVSAARRAYRPMGL